MFCISHQSSDTKESALNSVRPDQHQTFTECICCVPYWKGNEALGRVYDPLGGIPDPIAMGTDCFSYDCWLKPWLLFPAFGSVPERGAQNKSRVDSHNRNEGRFSKLRNGKGIPETQERGNYSWERTSAPHAGHSAQGWPFSSPHSRIPSLWSFLCSLRCGSHPLPRVWHIPLSSPHWKNCSGSEEQTTFPLGCLHDVLFHRSCSACSCGSSLRKAFLHFLFSASFIWTWRSRIPAKFLQCGRIKEEIWASG